MNIGKQLIKSGLITAEQLRLALERQVIFGGKIGTNLIELGLITEEQFTNFLSFFFMMPVADYSALSDIPEEITSIIGRDVADKYKMIPFKKENGKLHVAFMMTEDDRPMNKIKTLSDLDIVPYVASEYNMLDCLEKYYGIKNDLCSPVKLDLDEEDDDKTSNIGDAMINIKKAFISAHKSSQIIDILICEARKVSKRVAVFQVRGNTITGWKAAGLQVDGFKSKAVQYSVFSSVLMTRKYHRTPIIKIAGNEDLIETLGGATSDSLLVPIMLHGKTISILYADNGNTEVMDATLAYIHTICRLSALAFELLEIKKKILSL